LSQGDEYEDEDEVPAQHGETESLSGGGNGKSQMTPSSSAVIGLLLFVGLALLLNH
jgi:hypothetical protein